MSLLAGLGALAIGLSLGLTGAGGSILTLPVLVYLAGVPPTEAVGLSLFVVGMAAAIGAGQRLRSGAGAGAVHWRAALTFGLTGMLGAGLGARFTALVPAQYLMVGFALLMGVVALRMLSQGKNTQEPLPECKIGRCVAAGLAIGVLTGFIGVGGGFLLMPALIRFARLPVAMATGTSLLVIAANSGVGWISHLPSSAGRPWLLLIFSSFAVLGVLLGNRIAYKLPAHRLKQLFGSVVLLIAVWMLWQR